VHKVEYKIIRDAKKHVASSVTYWSLTSSSSSFCDRSWVIII